MIRRAARGFVVLPFADAQVFLPVVSSLALKPSKNPAGGLSIGWRAASKIA
jgi:hypothetical protein